MTSVRLSRYRTGQDARVGASAPIVVPYMLQLYVVVTPRKNLHDCHDAAFDQVTATTRDRRMYIDDLPKPLILPICHRAVAVRKQFRDWCLHTFEDTCRTCSAVSPPDEGFTICENVSSNKTVLPNTFLVEHNQVRIPCTSTYFSWLNQVKNWFSLIQRDVISRCIFVPVKDLDKKLTRYIKAHPKDPKPIKWKYDRPKMAIPPILLTQCCVAARRRPQKHAWVETILLLEVG